MRVLALVCMPLLLVACKGSGSAPAFDIEQPDQCGACHGNIVREWKQSMHARAHHSRDPVYAAIRKLRMSKEGPQIARACAECHSPRDVAQPDSAVAQVGVGCATCHNLAQVKPGARGAAALVRAEGNTMLGPHDLVPGRSPVHPTGAAPAHMKDTNQLCLACHGELKSDSGVPICTTGPEHASTGDAPSCASCHMPEVQGPSGKVSRRMTHRSHIFAGPHRAWYQDDAKLLEDAVSISGTFDGDTLRLELLNHSAHAAPSGFPGRTAVLALTGVDAKGQEVWKAFEKNPAQTAPELVFHKRYVDAEGKPTLAPWAKKLARDSRLRPDDPRLIELDVPSAVQEVRAQMRWFLLPGKLARKAKISDLKEARARVGTTAVIRRERP